MRHVTRMNESCHIWQSDSERDTCGLKRVTWFEACHVVETCHREKESCNIYMGHVKFKCVLSHMNVTYATRHTCGRGVAQRDGVVSHSNELCHICDMSHVQLRHGTQRKSCLPSSNEWVMSHVNASCQSPVHENGVCYTEVLQWARTSVYTEV